MDGLKEGWEGGGVGMLVQTPFTPQSEFPLPMLLLGLEIAGLFIPAVPR